MSAAEHDPTPAPDLEPGWGRVLRASLCRAVLATFCSLVVWSLLPAAWGWTPQVILSGSMSPRVAVGDVLVTRSVAVDDLRQGQVITVADPDHPGRTRTHRFVRVDSDGRLETKGDANEAADSTHVAPEDVHGVAVLRIPYVGLVAAWTGQRDWLRLLLFAAALCGALWGARMGHGRARTTRGPTSGFGPRPGTRKAAAAVAVGAVVVGVSGGPADAAFTGTATNPSS